jgi:ATP-dependent DNA helicase RecG
VTNIAIDSLAGVGNQRAKVLKQLGVATLGDLLEYFPRSYRLETAERSIGQLTPKDVQTARGEVVAVDYIAARPRPRFEATLDDGTGKLGTVWFHGGYLRTRIHPGVVLRVQGAVRYFHNMPQMANPKWEIIKPEVAPIEKATFRPIYPASGKLTSEVIHKLIDANLDGALQEVSEWFGPELLTKRELLGRKEAYRLIHRAANEREAAAARRRIIYDELILMQLGLGISKRRRSGGRAGPILRLDQRLDARIRRRFPFALTGGQNSAIQVIAKDLQSGRPMHRLLQGDVGSGKTVVAVYAMLMAVANKLQASLLAPTEVLAEQHYLTLLNLLRDSAVKIELFTHRTRRQGRQALADGDVHIAVGTQALLQPGVEFANLGVVVVDEQHKLGVRQRAELKGKGLSPHYLVMTATPIPRTLALSYFADFDITEIGDLPPGRQPIQTRLYKPEQESAVFTFVRQQAARGRQAYVVLPQIDDAGLEEVKSVRSEFARLGKGPLAGLRLSMLHGQMPTDEKQAVMAEFRDGQTDVLVATTVIEVGIDVPNATVMVIQNADRFGLSQLHQLRGRVGRGAEESHCLLISGVVSESATQRLKAMTQMRNGFEIAQKDLELRGPGEFFGTKQHGLPEFRMADITRELAMLELARQDALALLAGDPRLDLAKHAALREAVSEQFGEDLALAQIG